MPCYSAWHEYLEPGSAAYTEAEARVRAKLKALQHAVDYYYGSRGISVPPAESVRNPEPGSEFSPLVVPSGEPEVLNRLTHHLICDGVHVSELYDAVSLLREDDTGEAGYARVLLICAFRVRSSWAEPEPEQGEFTLVRGCWYAAEFIGDEFENDLRHYSPIRVDGLQALKSGRGELVLAFWHENYPAGVQDKEYRLRVLERGQRFLLARKVDSTPARLILTRDLTWKWLGDKCQLYPRRPNEDVQRRFERGGVDE